MESSIPLNIVILTGAGISAESGIRTFRDTGGLWEEHAIEDVATPEGFARDPALVHRFYNARRKALAQVAPNPAHFALARLEQKVITCGGYVTLVTQNVDDLHERGGSSNVIHMHGQLLSTKCQHCGQRWPSARDSLPGDTCPKCERVGGPRPDIVWFGEMPYYMGTIETALEACDLFVSIGTSGAVYPAAGFVQTAKAMGTATLELNLERSEGSSWFEETRLGPAGTIVPDWVDEVLSGFQD